LAESRRGLLTSYVLSHSPIYATAIGFIIVSNIVQSAFPKTLGRFTDDLQKGGITAAAIAHYGLLLLAIGVSYGVLFGIGHFTIARLGRRFEYVTRQKLFAHFTKLSEHFFSQHGIGELLSYVMNDVTSVRESISNGINQTTNAVFLILSCVVMMAFSSIPLYLIAVCVLPLLAIPFVVVRLGPVIRDRSLKVQESLASMTESAEEQFGGIRVTKTFAAEDMAMRRFGEKVDAIRDNQLRLVRVSSFFQALLPFLGALSLVLSIIVGGSLTVTRHITLGNFVELTLYLRMIVTPLQQIGNVINMMQRSRASLERINALLAQQPDIRSAANAEPLPEGPLGVRVRGLTFRYPGAAEPALRDISFDIEPGQTVAIVGKTGSGKTTLVKLLLRVYDPPRGTIRIGGRDIADITLDSLRRRIAYVPQDGFLFSTTIRDNIAFSDRSADLGEVEQAARQAQIAASIESFPQQFDTRLGERGITLSGGQRQRTSLARGFIKRAPILILDDSVSAVDAVTETNIIAGLRKSKTKQTTILIAHRLSAVQHADLILVLDEGRIVQRGTHAELLQQEGIYASLHAIQEEGIAHA
jgi:ATP-binding cassette subfamily B multidrug efflux pump